MKKFSSPSPVIRIGHFELNEPAAQISWFDTPLTLTRYEFLLLKTLLKSPGRVWSRQQLMDSVWEDAQDTYDRTVEPLTLTRYEFLLLKTLLKSPGRVWSRQQLMDSVWEDAQDTYDRTVDTHIKTLRAKLRAINPDLSPINTHRGMGYSLRGL